MQAGAVVYRCNARNAAVSYQAFPCGAEQGSQTVLPIITSRGAKNSANTAAINGLPQISIQPPARVSAKTNSTQPKQPRRRKTEQEKRQLEQAKAFKRQLRCNSVQLKIQLLHNRIRAGYTAKQEVRLQEQLQHYAQLQQKYCT